MKMLIAIDGAAGAFQTDDEYATAYQDSWTNRLYQRSTGRCEYFHADRIIFGDVFAQSREVAQWVVDHTEPDDEIAFTGFSRGGATCYLAAARLSHSLPSIHLEERRNVVAIGLFDPVANQIVADDDCSEAHFHSTVVYIARAETANPLFPPIAVNSAGAQIRMFEGDHRDLGGTANYVAESAYRWIGGMLADHGFVDSGSL